jgi:hypothetical protein
MERSPPKEKFLLPAKPILNKLDENKWNQTKNPYPWNLVYVQKQLRF